MWLLALYSLHLRDYPPQQDWQEANWSHWTIAKIKDTRARGSLATTTRSNSHRTPSSRGFRILGVGVP